jgi:CheY-like chemotaxis protein/CHASE3 domain sensor protein
MNLSISARIVLGFALTLAMLLTLGIGSYRHTSSLREDFNWLQHTHRVLEQNDELAAQLHQAQSLSRGYALSPTPELRQQYDSMARAVWQSLQTLRTLTVDNPTQQANLDRLQPLVDQRLGESQQLMGDDTDQVRAAVAQSVRQTFDQAQPLNQALSALETEERRLLNLRTAKSERTQASLSQLLLYGTLAAAVLKGLIVFLLTRVIRVQLQDLLTGARRLASGEYHERVAIRSQDEIGRLAAAFNDMAEQIQERQVSIEADRWLKDKLSRMSALFESERRLDVLAPVVLTELARATDAQQGLLYVAEPEGDGLKLLASHAAQGAPTRIEPGQGLVGQVLSTGIPIVLQEVPRDYIRIQSGLGGAAPAALLLQPAKLSGQVKAVIELAGLRPFTELQLSFMAQCAESFGLVLATIEASESTKRLLDQSLELTRELKSQSDKLRASELQLKEQQEELRQTNEELEQANEELQQANEEMEERATLLSEQKLGLERSNRDVEEARRMLERQSELLARTSKYKTEFLANMSHELRTPLNSLLILSKVLADNAEGNLTPKQVQHAKTVHASASDLLELINDILDLSKVEAGVVELEVTELRFDHFKEFIENTFAPIAQNKGLHFEVKVDPDLETMCSDLRRLQQIIKNLLSNALKFTHEGSVELHIRRAAREWAEPVHLLDTAEEVVAFEVRDTGIGIPEQSLQRIFEAFQQGESGTARKYGGTGLGLSISRDLAHRLGGTLRVSSEVGTGSVFTLYLPREASGAQLAYIAGTITTDTPASALVAQPRLEPRRTLPIVEPDSPVFEGDQLQPGDMSLLVIEDDAKFAHIIAQFAREKGFKVLIAQTAANGVALAKRIQPTAITLDLRLPDADGRVILDLLKHDASTRHIPVHVISVDDARDQSLRAGAVSFLQKPVTREALDEALSRTVEFAHRSVRNLLIVEDDQIQRDSILALVGEGDVNAVAVSSAAAAMREIEEKAFDCVVVDLLLPDQSGADLIRSIQARLGERSPPIIVYTAKSLSREEETELRRLSDAIIVKDARSPERLLDETALFLHRVQSKLPEPKRKLLEQVQRDDPQLSGRKVLVVDDDVRNIFAITTALESYRMSVVYAESGRGGLEMLETHPDISAVLMDVMMPEMDGFETTQRIRSDERFRHLPIIMVTAKAMKGDREKCLAAGASDYITKPVDMDQLRSLLRVWLYR